MNSGKVLWCLLTWAFAFDVLAEGSTTQVVLNDSTINYKGVITNEANKHVTDLINDSLSAIQTLEIESKGGEINAGIDLAEIVVKNKLNVRVTNYCLSSCSNYVFVSGYNKYLANDAVLGFHGGASSTVFDMSDFDNLPDNAKKQAKIQLEKYLEKTEIREREFFKGIGVSQTITTLGQIDEVSIEVTPKSVGWYYSIEDMMSLGVSNIFLLNDKQDWTPRRLSKDIEIVLIGLDRS